MQLASKYVARIESPQSKLNELSPERVKLNYPVYQDLLKRKAELMAELKEVEAEHKLKSDASIDSLAKLLALNKVQKTSDKNFAEVSKQYVGFMRKKMSSAGRKLITNQDLLMFQQLAEAQFKLSSNKKQPDLAVKLGEEVGENFRRFIRTNFAELKKAEQQHLAKITEFREKANRKASMFRSNTVKTNRGNVEISDEDILSRVPEDESLLDSEVNQSERKETFKDQTEISPVARADVDMSGEEEEDFNIETVPANEELPKYPQEEENAENQDTVQFVESEEESPPPAREDYRLSNVNHPKGLLESEVREGETAKDNYFDSEEDEKMIQNEGKFGLDSFQIERNDKEKYVDSLANDEENMWESAMDGNDSLRLPSSHIDYEKPEDSYRKRCGTEAIRVLAESQVDDYQSPKSTINFLRGGSASSDFTSNDRESIVKRLPIPALETGSNIHMEEEIKMTDEGNSEDLIKLSPVDH